MKLIGHRGAAGLAPENTIESFQTAMRIGVDALEFDLRLTSDQQIVVNHDASLKRAFGVNMTISQHTLAELQKACPKLPTLNQVLQACGDTALVIELKELIPPELLQAALATSPKSQYSLVSFKLEALQSIKHVFPGVHMSLLSFAWPCWKEHLAKKNSLQGIGVYWLFLNPLVYWQAKRHSLEIYTYSLNNALLTRIITRLYPRVAVCSDRPDLLQPLRS